MCYEGKCFYCIPVKTACFVVAIFNAVINGLLLIWWLMSFGVIMLLFMLGSGGSNFKVGGVRFKRDIDDYDIMMMFTIIIVPLLALFNFIFTVVLCCGISNRKPKQVKIFFWYDVIKTILVFVTSVMMLTIDFGSESYPDCLVTATGRSWLVECALQSLFLVLVHFTHKKLVEDNFVTLENTEFRDTKYLVKV